MTEFKDENFYGRTFKANDHDPEGVDEAEFNRIANSFGAQLSDWIAAKRRSELVWDDDDNVDAGSYAMRLSIESSVLLRLLACNLGEFKMLCPELAPSFESMVAILERESVEYIDVHGPYDWTTRKPYPKAKQSRNLARKLNKGRKKR